MYSLFHPTTIVALLFLHGSAAWVSSPGPSISRTNPLQMALGLKIGKSYTPKWKKQKTLVETEGDINPQDKGIVGTTRIVFKCGEASISTLASPGDPIRDVASQAGQFIKYGCGKGECGTCESKCGTSYIKPCIAVVPGDIADGEDYVIEVKEVKNKARSSGKFYSVRSFLMGFYNNVLGMFAFVKTRKSANNNYNDRIEFEAMIARKAAERKAKVDMKD